METVQITENLAAINEAYRSWRQRLSLHSVHREPVGRRT
jgi:hypothetical protein